MRKVSPIKLIVLTALLLVTALTVHGRSGKHTQVAIKEPLQQYFSRLGDGRFARDISMADSIVTALKLDDYLFKSYAREKGPVNLYIGYYRTAKKVGAAHDPLVCFTGQGWQINGSERADYNLVRDPHLKISYSSMIAERQGERELIVYWFQSNDKAAATPQTQKFFMVLDKLYGRNEDNAFVRLSAPIKDESPETVRKRIFDFIDDFYPDFYRYVTRS